MTAPFIATTSLALPAQTPFGEWKKVGMTLASQKRCLDWLIGDWITFGREHFPEQIDLALGELSDDAQKLRRIERTVRAFPPHLRDARLSFDHHAHVADLPTQEALPMLRHAADDKITARQLRVEAMLKKIEVGQILPREEDFEDDALLAIVRSWNRAPFSVRKEFAEMMADSHLGVIEP